MNNYILEVKNLKVSYLNRKRSFFGKAQKVEVLHGVDLSIKEGEVLGLVGESGCGKSTLAKAVLGLIPYEGEVFHHSNRPQMVFQDPFSSLNPSKTIGWLLEEPLKIKGERDTRVRKEKAVAMLERVGLSEEYYDRFPRQLSGGQRQRVCIGVALMLEPKLLIADEPVSALDVTIQAQVLDLLLKLKEEMGLSILFISHDLRVVYRMCERVCIMQNGMIAEQGNREDIYFNPQHEYTKVLLQSAGINEHSNP